MFVHSFRCASIALGLALVAGTATAVEPSCTPLPDGDFVEGGAGWTFVPLEEMKSDAGAFASVGVADQSGYIGIHGTPIFDEHALTMIASASAGVGGGTGSATAQATATTSVVATERVLHLVRGGGFEFQYVGVPGFSLEVVVRVEGPGGTQAEAVLYENTVETTDLCGLGLAVLGTLDTVPPTLTLDLLPAGIHRGDPVDVTVELRATASAISPCQLIICDGFLIVDEFEFCTHPADLDADGTVGTSDLLEMLASWGVCPAPCPPSCDADLNGDCAVGIGDLLALLGAWGG